MRKAKVLETLNPRTSQLFGTSSTESAVGSTTFAGAIGGGVRAHALTLASAIFCLYWR